MKQAKQAKKEKDRASMRERREKRRERRGRQSQRSDAKGEQKQRRQKKEKKSKQDTAPVPEQFQDEGDVDFNALQEDQPEQIQVSFLVAEIHQKYYHSMKTVFLKSSPLYQATDAELADAVIKNVIGNVVLADDEEQFSESVQSDQENVYSILTILPGRQQLTERLKKIACKSIDSESKLMVVILSESTSVLVNERLPNLPAFVVESAHSVFRGDLLKEKKKAPAYLLNVSQVQHQGSDRLEELIFSKFEDYEMCLRGEWWLGDAVKTHRKEANMRKLYYLIKFEQYLQGVTQLATYLES